MDGYFNDYKVNVRIGDGTVCDGFLWFSNTESNGLYRTNIKSKVTEFVDYFPDGERGAYFMHKRCFSYGKRLVFVPAYARNISIYDVEKKEFHTIGFDNDIEGEAVLDAVQIEKNIYIFPRHAVCKPIRMDADNLEIHRMDGLDIQIDKYIEHDNPEKFYRTCENGGNIFFPLNGTDVIARWNPQNGDFDAFHTGQQKIVNLLVKGEKCFFTVREEYGLRTYDFQSGKTGRMECNRRNDSGENMYGCLVFAQSMIMAVPSFGAYIHGFQNGRVVFEYCFDESIKKQYKFFKCLDTGSEIWFFPIGIEDMYILRADGKVEKVPMMFDEKTKEYIMLEHMKDSFAQNLIAYESDRIGLREFLSFVDRG